jgi:tetratricopeptide (TPR) repeat protein
MRTLPSCSLITFLVAVPLRAADLPNSPKPSELTLAVQAYRDDHLKTALGHFIQVLDQDRANAEAHAYIHLIVHKLQERQARKNREEALEILKATSQVLQSRHEDSHVIDTALARTLAEDAQRESTELHEKCTEAQIEAQVAHHDVTHLTAANDLVLQVIAKDPNDREAQQLLSDLQGQIQQTLGSQKDLPVTQRHVLEGFYAYGQADWTSAAAAWGQARSALAETLPPEEAAHQVALLHFETYEKIAQGHLDEELRQKHAQALFNEGRAAYDKHDFKGAAQSFRQVALINPEFSQLGFYLVNSEAAVERERTQDLSDQKRQQATEAFTKGISEMAKGHFGEAEASFKDVLSLDPSHPKARQYLAQIDAQKDRHSDPQAAQQHYEAGLISYAGGDSEQALREWRIAQRLDPDNPKITDAVDKAQRELVLSKELP